MNIFFKIAAYLFHPLWMPTYGVALYFFVTPRFVLPELVQSKLLVVFIITFLIPLMVFFLLKNLGSIKSIDLVDIRERRIPLMIQCILLIILIKIVFDSPYLSELYYFFVGVLCSAITAFILVLFKFKVSLHMIGIAGVTMFLIALSIHFKVNTLHTITILLLINGWIASSRLHTQSHTGIEIVIGFFVGLIPQIIFVNYWL